MKERRFSIWSVIAILALVSLIVALRHPPYLSTSGQQPNHDRVRGVLAGFYVAEIAIVGLFAVTNILRALDVSAQRLQSVVAIARRLLLLAMMICFLGFSLLPVVFNIS